MDLLNQEQNDTFEKTNTLNDILNSINNDDSSNSNNINIKKQENELNNLEINEEQIQNIVEKQDLPQQVQLLSNSIDRRIGNFLLDELEKKQIYINELEEALKFQEKEIAELKNKLEAFNKLELLSKIKSNMENKLVETETNLSQAVEQENKHKVIQVKKTTQINQQEQNDYPKSNPDLVFSSDPGLKVKSIPKEEEEPRYNGVMMLEKPKNEPQIKIQMDYDTETCDSTSMSDVIKQRRRAIRL